MTGNIPTVGTGVWSLLLGSGTITTPNSGTTTVTNLGLGQNIFLWTITNGVCFQSASSVILTINPLPSAAAASSNTVVCISSPTTPIFGNTPAVGTGTWSVASGSGTITAPNSPTTTATNLGLGINILQWGVGTVGCAPTTATIAVQIDNVPTPALAGPNQTLCINNPTTTLAGNSVTVGSGVWSVVFGTANIISILNPSTAVTGLTTGTNVLQWTTTNGVCAPSISTMSIQVDNNTVFASAGPNQTLCAASPSTTLAGNTPTVGIGTWGVLVGSGSVTTPSLSNSTITGLGTGTNILQWVVVNGVCSFNSSIVYLYVIPSPGLPNAGASQTLCVSNPTTTIAANTPSLGTASWSVVSGSANIVTPLTNTSNVLSLPVGDNVLAWTMTHSVCSLTSTLNIHVDNIPSLPIAGPNQTICISSPTTVLAANTPTSGVGTWSLMSGSGTITTPTLATSSVTGLGLGINVLQWTINGGACGTNSSTMSIKVDNIPTTAIAGPNQTLCISNPTTTLGGNIPAIGIGTWSVMVGSGIITTSTLGTSGVTGLLVGVNVLEWSIASGGCGSTTSTMSIQVDGIPSISVAGTNQTLCVNSPSTTLNGNVPTVGVGTWSVLSGSGTIASPTLATSNITGLTIGLNILEWSISSGTCGVSSSTMSIQLDAAPTSPSVSVSQTICAVNPTATISGNVPTVGTGSWSLVSGSGTITSPTSATTTLNNLGVGVNVFEWVITNGVCVAPIATVAITVDPATTIANAGANQTICINSSALMTANSAAIGTGSWTVVSGSGTIITPTSANTSITNLGLGINVFAWTISNNCSTSTSTVSITKDQVPSASIAGADQNFCGATTFNLNAVNPVIGSGCWSVLFGGSSVSNPTLNISTLTGLTTGTNALIWTVTNGSCPPSKDTVQIIIDALPTSADAGIDQTTCVTSATLNGNAPTVGVGVWTVAGGSPVITNPLLNNSAITVLSAPTNIFVWCVCNGICPMSSDTVIITVLPPTNSAFAGNDTTIFINQVTLTANNPAPGIGLWTLVSGNANIVNPSSFVTAVNSLKPGLNTLKWTITGLCGITEDDINITLIDTEVPNGISPNGDGKNEYFEIPFIGSYTKVEIKIINRWGNLVYENTNYKNDWNGLNQEGQTLADDTYFYVLNLDNILKTGYITIKR
jgi:gliding motility-associated-like protein